MSMDQAAFFLSGSLLIMLGFVVIFVGIAVINNLLHKYWKPVQLFKWMEYKESQHFLTQEDLEKIVNKVIEQRKEKNE